MTAVAAREERVNLKLGFGGLTVVWRDEWKKRKAALECCDVFDHCRL